MKNKFIITLCMLSLTAAFAQNKTTSPIKVQTKVKSEKHSSSSILLWMRTDTPRQAGMDRWKGPHSKIISANKGLLEYRQIHLAENNTGLWQPIKGVETIIPSGRKIDGIADVTLKNVFSIFRGKKQNKLASKDEVNIFRRTILYASLGNASRWYEAAPPSDAVKARSIVFFSIKEGVSENDFKKYITEELTPTLANMGVLKELRSKVYMPWKEKQWNTPGVAHDNAKEVQFQASLMVGFADANAMAAFFTGDEIKKSADRLSLFCSAIHAYEIQETITFVEDGKIIH